MRQLHPDGGVSFVDLNQGMTLRQYYAGLAMQGMIAAKDEYSFTWTHEGGEVRFLGYGAMPAGPGWTRTETPTQKLYRQAVAHADGLIAELENQSDA